MKPLRNVLRKLRKWNIERTIQKTVRRHRGLNEEMMLMADELDDEIRDHCPDQESEIIYCRRQLDSDYWHRNALLASFGEDVFAKALRRKFMWPARRQ